MHPSELSRFINKFPRLSSDFSIGYIPETFLEVFLKSNHSKWQAKKKNYQNKKIIVEKKMLLIKT